MSASFVRVKIKHMENKTKIRPILAELKGYLSVAPSPEKQSRIYDAQIWNQYNSTINELNSLSENNYDKFRLVPQGEEMNRSYSTIIKTQDYVGKLSGLINRIQAEYFSDEPSFHGGPTTVINANQTQTQKQEQNMIIDLAMFVAENKSNHPAGTPERDFLDKFGTAIKNSNGITDIIKNMIEIGTSCGLTLPAISKIFGF